MSDDDELREYAENSTLWLLGQYLGWVEILRREAQFLDFGKRAKNRALREALGRVAAAMATDAVGKRFAVFRTAQRAIGELMIAEADADASKPTSSLGFAQFVQSLTEDRFDRWFSRLRRDLNAIAAEQDWNRLIFVQRALVDLVDQLDPDRILYPVVDTRGKLPLPDRQPARQVPAERDRVARFVARPSEYGAVWSSFPEPLLAAWAERHGLEMRNRPSIGWWTCEGSGKGRWLNGRLVLDAVYDAPWLEIYATVVPPGWARFLRLANSNLPANAGGWRFRRSRRRKRAVANDLLQQLDRPTLR